MNRLLYLLLIAMFAASPHPACAQASKAAAHNAAVAKNLDIFCSLYRELDLYYADTLSADKTVGNAIGHMLQNLDPYTEYYADDETSDLRQLTTGRYAGIGTMTVYRPDLKRCIIHQPFAEQPAALAGLQAGDIILAIDGEDLGECKASTREAQDAYTDRVSQLLRGTPGTSFTMKVRRATTNRNLTVRLTRQSIVRPSVNAALLISDSVAYISLSQFIDGTAGEVQRALTSLKQLGARKLVLDLRGNPGGVMDEAIKLVGLFVPRGREVVTTRGKVREMNQTYRTPLDPIDPDIPIVVLTDGGTASAAEITSGALQDYDRAVIMGARTYGKGLVQSSRTLPYKSALKLTTGRYYIPSGRCIQAYKFENGQPKALPDSLAHEFQTAAGRTVRDGGGIMPDIALTQDTLPAFLIYLKASTVLFDYAVAYHAAHDKDEVPAARNFRLTDDDFADLAKHLHESDFTYDHQSQRALRQLEQIAQAEGFTQSDEVKSQLNALRQSLQPNLDADLKRWEPQVRRIAESAIVEKYYYEAGQKEYETLRDEQVQQAVDLLNNPVRIQKILTGEPDA